ncbi:peptide/nickel transport system substrate-binding protein [Tistlia consotensis]|uniref:Peptide/nickel transport system substrate-binding protein n=1 Tax=Tistlia consotensis USBA 355 TaxID=560819 RepID=A0A1Y6C930_9PROT|nr:ABC transporter substrate-binding protein [Tistlia consotensis]SMF43576.1 peptide/nickel transport system substrate-binding protein [Tistlia consotensis USBA 355]SNR42709.1 peptide/nickel transport system substrate-binding protein [Tistlia consotensis]
MPIERLAGRTAVAALALAAALGLAAWGAAARAGTPADTLVIADKIDDIVSLDPAESFEFSGNDLLNNTYDTLVELDPRKLGPLVPGIAESWKLADDGVTYTFKIRQGLTFESGNPVTAEDAAWSLHRAVKLDKTPSFILTQFGFNAENVDQMIRATGPYELTIVTDKPYAPSFFYNCLTAVVASVVDKKEALSHEVDGDFGYGWLKTHTAGSGAYHLRSFKPIDSYVLEANESYWRGVPAMKRVFVRHVPEPATQRLLLEHGDIDVARKLTPVDIQGIEGNPDLKVQDEVRGQIRYISLNQKVKPLDNPKVVEAFKYLIDYDGMVNSFLKGQFTVHQAFLPKGFLGAIDDRPYKLDIDKAKALLAEAGVKDLHVRIFVRNDQDRLEVAQALQNTWAKAGITAELRVGTGKEILTEYRARKHDIYLGDWGPDYPDPNTNADTFARNPDNSDDAQLTGILAWRNAWPASEVNDMTDAAVLEKDSDKRAKLYEEIQRIHQKVSPFAVMFQRIEQVALRKNVQGFSAGGSIHSAFYWATTKE